MARTHWTADKRYYLTVRARKARGLRVGARVSWTQDGTERCAVVIGLRQWGVATVAMVNATGRRREYDMLGSDYTYVPAVALTAIT